MILTETQLFPFCLVEILVILVDTDDDILHQRKKEQVNEENTGHSFISYFKRATMPLVVLNFLKEQPMYGYEITEAGRASARKKPGMSIGKPDVFVALIRSTKVSSLM